MSRSLWLEKRLELAKTLVLAKREATHVFKWEGQPEDLVDSTWATILWHAGRMLEQAGFPEPKE